jgi:hypothetical protein
MNVWVCVCQTPSTGDLYLKLFDNEEDALNFACKDVILYMKSLGCDDPSHTDYVNFQDVVKAVSNKSYKEALDIYNEWNVDLEYDSLYSVGVIHKTVDCNNQSKVEKPCNCCGRKNYIGEMNCWWCGNNPG